MGMNFCEECGDAFLDGQYDNGYEDGYTAAKKDRPDLVEWSYENRHMLTAMERELLERVADHMTRGAKL